MNLPTDAFAERRIYELMALNRARTGELLGDDNRLIVSLAVRAHLHLRALQTRAYQFFYLSRIHLVFPAAVRAVV